MVLIDCLIVFDVVLQIHFLVILPIIINVISTESGAYTVIYTEGCKTWWQAKRGFVLLSVFCSYLFYKYLSPDGIHCFYTLGWTQKSTTPIKMETKWTVYTIATYIQQYTHTHKILTQQHYKINLLVILIPIITAFGGGTGLYWLIRGKIWCHYLGIFTFFHHKLSIRNNIYCLHYIYISLRYACTRCARYGISSWYIYIPYTVYIVSNPITCDKNYKKPK